ncbi:MAG: B12-binding domain-containing radical SAM protein [Desulfobulbaceae bacterium]|nr:B12-binding domain-containing radical SAM protein [Desulfobulbaceae bacterium]
MDILLINPPNSGRSIPEERYGIESIKQIFRGEPLALGVLAGNLVDSHQVTIADLKADSESVNKYLQQKSPDVVGITGMTCEAQAMKKIAARIRKECSAKVVVGGIHASSDPEFFNCADIDYIVVGLGKQSFRELVDALSQAENAPAIPGVAATSPGNKLSYLPRKFSVADLVDDTPPAYGLVNHYRPEYYLSALKLEMGFVVTAFGCPFNCAFCCIKNLTGGAYLNHSIESVIRDIRSLGDIPVIRLLDANTFGNLDHARKLAAAIREADLNKKFLADVRSDTVVNHPDLMKEWKEAGLKAVIIGFEEISDQNLQKMNKSNRVEVNTKSIAILHDLGITIVGDFIISPDYTEAEFLALGNYIEDNKIDLPMITVMTPLPGTKQYKEMKPLITEDDLDYYTLTNAVIPTRLPEHVFYQHYANLIKSGHQGAQL